ncbi:MULTISPECIES: helix-turn-helix domain-containing protein [Streptomyces]|uniref:Helix-turn-helix transcriptional regulator n=1 Tax=Streptomyces thermoviolaceus subsp. thermoviolaceus TaxID=66860 RepID=A0ABX0YW78_STRTL|nr:MULTISPECIES: helix-turn-helix transcriptional regulator [Streptomyces]MCM3265650.1 helix-turn-helix domain-containing protein [Streptomyces thermoviolaceus]NJP16584.1 helix-turn-helix transcriptional regulator [Streptomyces thermoviolaceus subsp. thermoviolaceus]RSR97606.1 XRE family transcriptional regulator [Streptomyces sp. WAC00469]WTD46562.1 helix-turn-helix domain-containing protein [Streptomyces thermoviolaceus]GGV82079.1 transcriptional regulator [Streptomyces thermoviolaceus subsp
MTDGIEDPGTSVSPVLTAVVARVTALADRLGVPHAEVFDVGRLSVASGVPEPVVRALLSGRPAGEPDVQARFLQRLDLLRRTRLKPNGRRYTQQEIADGAGMSRQQAGALINGDRRPTMEHCDAIQRFFRVHAGFLTAEDPEALAGALQQTEQELLQRLAEREAAAAADDPLERLLQNHGVRSIAWRAAQLPTDRHRDKVAEWLDMLLESVKRPES